MTSTKINRKQAFLEAYKKSLFNISEACRAIGINRTTYYTWIEKYPKFKEELELAEKQMDDIAENSLYKNVKKGIQKAVEFYLTNRKKDKYSNNQNIEVTIPKVVKEVIYIQDKPPEIIEK
jgi:transposase-like protein